MAMAGYRRTDSTPKRVDQFRNKLACDFVTILVSFSKHFLRSRLGRVKPGTSWGFL